MKRFFLPLAMMTLWAGVAVASPFNDISSSHWAYDAVKKLSEEGIFRGTSAGKFSGYQNVSRYELAVTTARMLARVEQVMTGGDKKAMVAKEEFETLERLKNEYAEELASLGIKAGALSEDIAASKAEVSSLRHEVDKIKSEMQHGVQEKVKLSGNLLVRHSNLIHRNDWATNNFSGAIRPGNSNNVLTESQFRFKFTAKIDENITAVARWVVFAKNAENVNAAASSARGGAFGRSGIGNLAFSDNVLNLAHLNVKNFFGRPGELTLGRVIYVSNHGLLVNNYLDVARYGRKVGDVEVLFQTVFDRHEGSYKDRGQLVDFRPLINLDLKTRWNDHNLYLGLFAQDEPSVAIRRGAKFVRSANAPTLAELAAGNMGSQAGDSRRDLEFGSKGLIAKNQHWKYDLAFAYSAYSIDMANDATTAVNPYRDVELKSWSGLIGVAYDTKKAWAGKIGYCFADDESIGGITILNDMRYVDFCESPTEDVGRGNAYFTNGLQNMSDLKLQAEYKPEKSKHYARLAWDILDELKSAPVNDLNRYRAGDGLSGAIPVANNNSVYDRTNNLGVADPKSNVVTLEYRYRLTKNTRIRLGYTRFAFLGDAVKSAAATNAIKAGHGWNSDYDYTFAWSEIFSNF